MMRGVGVFTGLLQQVHLITYALLKDLTYGADGSHGVRQR